VMQADLRGLTQVFYNGSYYSTDDGKINLSLIDWTKRQSHDGVFLDETAVLSPYANQSVEFQEVLAACVELHNKVAYLLELFKCGTFNISSHANCANYTEWGGTETAYQSVVFNFSRLNAVRFFQASVENVARNFFSVPHYESLYTYTPRFTLVEVYNQLGYPATYTSAPSSPRQLDASVLDYSLSMRGNATALDDPHILHSFSTATAECRTNQAILQNMSARTNRRLNMFKNLVQPFHSKIRPEYQSLAAIQDAKAVSMNLTSYGSLLSSLGLSSSGHPQPAANPLAGALLDSNSANNVYSAAWAGSVPTFPQAIFAATFQRAHDAILQDPNRVVTLPTDAENNYPQNANIDEVVQEYVLWDDCWQDPSVSYIYPRQGCNNVSLWAFVILNGQAENFWGLGYDSQSYSFNPLPQSTTQPLVIRYTNNDEPYWMVDQNLKAIWFFIMFDNYVPGFKQVFTLPVALGTNNPGSQSIFPNYGITRCLSDVVHSNAPVYTNTWSVYAPTQCGVCA
jgi:hypothetical protein